MPAHKVEARALPDVPPPRMIRDPDVVAAYLEDASSGDPGVAPAVVRPESEAEAAAFLRATREAGVAVLPQAARSSLTGGAVPRGEVVLSVERLTAVGAPHRHADLALIQVEPGVRLKDLQAHLSGLGLYFPPVPTYQEAMVGGAVSTNAGGAATFKYGVTRQWVEAVRVLLWNGDLVEVERGQAVADRGESFEVRLSDGTLLSVPAPTYELPPLKKISAGYHAATPLDLVDLFVGAEGTLGLITGVTLRAIERPAAVVAGLTFCDSNAAALALTEGLRDAGRRAGAAADAPDVRAVEFLDGRSLALLRRHGDDRSLRVVIPPEAGAAIFFEVELDAAVDAEATQAALEAVLDGVEGGPPRLAGLFRILEAHGALDRLELAFPGDEGRQAALRDLREAVPRRVNEMLAERRRADPAVSKLGGDLIVPFAELGAMLDVYRDGFERRGLEYAIWGHVSDGNLHPNVIARDARDVGLGKEAQIEFAREAAGRGGSPLSEHGVGRSPLKQEILRRFLGDRALDEMRAVKRALDPGGRFAPGVLFPRS